MQAIVVPKNGFPLRRKTSCCGKETKVGESCVVIPMKDGNTVTRQMILHRRCLAAFIKDLPLDARDYAARFDTIREAVLTEGNAFPDRRQTRNGKGSDGR